MKIIATFFLGGVLLAACPPSGNIDPGQEVRIIPQGSTANSTCETSLGKYMSSSSSLCKDARWRLYANWLYTYGLQFDNGAINYCPNGLVSTAADCR